ncbi:MAG: AraC family transcriptional regulator [Myxococcota bacterium]
MKRETQSFYEAAVRRAVEQVARSLDRSVDLEALARSAALSTFHFHRVFRGLVGETPLELHRRLRLERAAEWLYRSDPGILEVALDAGYDSHEAFTRAFRAAYGVAPSTFRARPEGACHPGPPTALAARCGLHVRDDRVDLRDLTLVHPGEVHMDVVIETLPARRLAAVRHVGPYTEISRAFHELGALAATTGLYGTVEPQMLALYHDDPETTPPSELRSDAALVVRGDAPLPPGLTEVRLPAGEYARATHIGAYTGLGDAWARFLGGWLPHSGRRLGDGPSYEVYVTDPRTTPTEALRTDLYVPVG